MTSTIPPTAILQVDVTGGSPVFVAAAFALLLVATVLSLLLTYRFVSGYLQTRTRPYLLLATGMLLLTAVPIFARLVLVNVADIPAAYRSLVTSGSELLGLLIILYTIHR